MNHDIRRKLDRITGTLWAGGVTNPVTYIEQLSYLIYLKLLDEEESNRERRARMTGGKSPTPSLFPNGGAKFRWSQWRFKSGTELRDFVRDKVFPYMASKMNEEPQVADYFRDAVLEILDPNVLKQVIDELDTIDFVKLGPDVKGDIFEYLLTHLGSSSLNGQFRTPRQIRSLMVQMVDPDLGDTICDPACGTAGFLIDSVEHILAKYSAKPIEVPIYGEEWLEKQGKSVEQLKTENPALQTYRKGAGEKLPSWKKLEASVFGFDVSRQMLRIAMMNLVLHGVRRANLKRANVLSDMGGMSEADLGRKYKVILANPPFAGKLPEESIRQDLPTNSKKSELLFLSVMMESLAPGGLCAVVVPEGVLFAASNAHVELRRRLVQDFEMLAVVSLPGGAFKPYTGVKTSVLVFRRPVDGHSVKRVWFYEVSNDGYATDRVYGGGRPETPAENDIPHLLASWREYRESGFKRPPGVRAGTSLAEGSPTPRCWWADSKDVSQGEVVLTASRYKPHGTGASIGDDPVEIAADLMHRQAAITSALEELMAELGRAE